MMKKRSMQKLEKERLEVHDSNSILMKKYSDANLNEQLLLKELNEITKKQYLDDNPNLKPL